MNSSSGKGRGEGMWLTGITCDKCFTRDRTKVPRAREQEVSNSGERRGEVWEGRYSEGLGQGILGRGHIVSWDLLGGGLAAGQKRCRMWTVKGRPWPGHEGLCHLWEVTKILFLEKRRDQICIVGRSLWQQQKVRICLGESGSKKWDRKLSPFFKSRMKRVAFQF